MMLHTMEIHDNHGVTKLDGTIKKGSHGGPRRYRRYNRPSSIDRGDLIKMKTIKKPDNIVLSTIKNLFNRSRTYLRRNRKDVDEDSGVFMACKQPERARLTQRTRFLGKQEATPVLPRYMRRRGNEREARPSVQPSNRLINFSYPPPTLNNNIVSKVYLLFILFFLFLYKCKYQLYKIL